MKRSPLGERGSHRSQKVARQVLIVRLVEFSALVRGEELHKFLLDGDDFTGVERDLLTIRRLVLPEASAQVGEEWQVEILTL